MKRFTKLLLVSTLVLACMCMLAACNRGDGKNNESGDMASSVEQSPTPTNTPSAVTSPSPTKQPADAGENHTAAPEASHDGLLDDAVHGAEDVVDGVVDGVEDVVDGVGNGIKDVTEPNTQPG